MFHKIIFESYDILKKLDTFFTYIVGLIESKNTLKGLFSTKKEMGTGLTS